MGCSSSIHAAPPTSTGQATQQGGVKPQPVTPDSRLLRGQAHYAGGKVAEALKEFNAIIASWPTYARAYLERGNVRFDQGDYFLACGDYTTALQLQVNLLQAYMMRCHARMALRQFAEALQDAREAERLDPENAQVKALKAQVRKAHAGTGGAAVPTLGSLVVAVGGGGGGGSTGGVGGCCEEEDAFAGLDTPKSTPSPSVRKLCMVCMDAERECRLRPCMHAALCVACAEGLMARGYGCPICSSKVEQVERGSFMQTFTVEEAQGIVASARMAAPPVSSGKSPLSRRFPPGPTPATPALDNIVEGDEESHTAVDGALEAAAAAAAAEAAAAAQGRRNSSGSGASSGGGRPSTPPVVLDPHPLARRSAAAVAAAAAGEEEVGAAAAAGPRPPLPGEVVSYDDVQEVTSDERQDGAAEAVAERERERGTLLRRRGGDNNGGGITEGTEEGGGGSGGGNDGFAAPNNRGGGDFACDVIDNVADGTVSDADTSPTALSAVASTYLANSLADWIDEHGGDGGGDRPAAATAVVQTQLTLIEEGTDGAATASATEDAEAAAGEGRQNLAGFASTSPATKAAAAAMMEIEPVGDANADVVLGGTSAVAAAAAAGDDLAVTAADWAPAATAVAEPVGTAVAGPVAEGRGGAAAATTAAYHDPAGLLAFHGFTCPHSQPHVNHRQPRAVEQRRTRRCAARSLAARAEAKAGTSTTAAIATAAAATATAAGSLHKTVGGTYASCGAAAAAARPFCRERTANGRRGGPNAAMVGVAPTAAVALAVLPLPRSRSVSGRADAHAARSSNGSGNGSGRAVGSSDSWSVDLRRCHGTAAAVEAVLPLPGTRSA